MNGRDRGRLSRINGESVNRTVLPIGKKGGCGALFLFSAPLFLFRQTIGGAFGKLVVE